MNHNTASITQLLQRAASGEPTAEDELFRAVEAELRRRAGGYLRTEPADPGLQTTVLVNEAFVRLVVNDAGATFENRKHFYCAAAKAMRNILVDHARMRDAGKRGGRARTEPLDNVGAFVDLDQMLDLHEALAILAKVDPRAAQVVELRYFGGRTHEETAEVLEISVRTAKSDWAAARAFLFEHLREGSS